MGDACGTPTHAGGEMVGRGLHALGEGKGAYLWASKLEKRKEEERRGKRSKRGGRVGEKGLEVGRQRERRGRERVLQIWEAYKFEG